jgi:hypothetical protein
VNENGVIGPAQMGDGAIFAIPMYKNFSNDDIIEIQFPQYPARHAETETPIADRDFTFTLPTPLAPVPAEAGPVTEPGGGTRPPVPFESLQFRIDKEHLLFTSTALFHSHTTYTVIKAGAADTDKVTSEPVTITVDGRGT